jgi:osmotically-inducible protein OsmY
VTGKDINVAVAGHVVTLTGFVRTMAEKYAAGKTAQATNSVKVVANDIEVKPETVRGDTDIAQDLVDALRLNVTVPDDKITAAVVDGFVTLKGALEWDFQRKAVEACVRDIAGVKGVINHIKIKPKASALKVATKIEDALRRSAELDARRITVSATDSTVYLNGTVHSWFEREEAERAAWAAPGVIDVLDNITVVPY